MTAHPLVLVLISPQDIVNVASAARLCCNFGVAQLRLVQPEVFDPWRIEGIAHGTGDFIRGITLHDSLAEALAGTTYAAVLTGRERAAKRQVARPREAAAALAGRLAEGPVALVAGREDTGLTNEELDQCRLLVTIATTPAFTSLNLAQAVGIMLHELWVARGGDRVPFKPPRREAGPQPLRGRLAPPVEERVHADERHERLGDVDRAAARVERVHLDAAEVRHVQQRGEVVRHEVGDEALAGVLARHGAARDPIRGVGRRGLLVEEGAGDAVGHPLHRERPLAQVREDELGDVEVVGEDVALRVALLGPEDLVEVGQA